MDKIQFKLNNLFISFSMLFLVLPGGTAVVSSPGAAVLSFEARHGTQVMYENLDNHLVTSKKKLIIKLESLTTDSSSLIPYYFLQSYLVEQLSFLHLMLQCFPLWLNGTKEIKENLVDHFRTDKKKTNTKARNSTTDSFSLIIFFSPAPCYSQPYLVEQLLFLHLVLQYFPLWLRNGAKVIKVIEVHKGYSSSM